MAMYQELKGYRDLKVYQLAYKLAACCLLHTETIR
jgi:hypothetical protein